MWNNRYPPDNAVDGKADAMNKDPLACTLEHTNPTEVWWMVELSEPTRITGVTVYTQWYAGKESE